MSSVLSKLGVLAYADTGRRKHSDCELMFWKLSFQVRTENERYGPAVTRSRGPCQMVDNK